MPSKQFSLCVPVYWPGSLWPQVMHGYDSQTAKPSQALVISSGASPADLVLAENTGFVCLSIPTSAFDHGATRQLAVTSCSQSSEIIVFLTQDAILCDKDSLRNLLRAFNDPSVGAAWGRQLPHQNATAIAAHARHYNYPIQSRCVGAEDIERLGIKSAFCSNSFAAYRISALQKVGGFLSPAVHGEDMHAAGRLLSTGYRIAYVADAVVAHSHNYSPWQELCRYFDTGAFHAENPWLLEQFGTPSGDGRRFVRSELRYLWQHAPWSIPRAVLSTVGKLLGYRLGTHFNSLPRAWPLHLGMNKTYWKNWHEKQVGSSGI